MKNFSVVLREVDAFEEGAYCFNDASGEINTPVHTHNKHQLMYAQGGTVHIQTSDKHWFLPARHYMWIPAEVSHRTWTNSSHVNLYTIYFERAAAEDPFYWQTGIYILNDLLKEMVLFTHDWTGHIGKSQINKYRFLLSIKAILPEINQNKRVLPFTHPYPKDKRLLEVAAYINSHLDEPISLSDLARKFGFSSRTLSRLFQEDMGMSYIRFVKVLRIMKAFELLVEDKLNINEIAYQVGYSSLPTFSNTFYELTGIRPTEYLHKA